MEDGLALERYVPHALRYQRGRVGAPFAQVPQVPGDVVTVFLAGQDEAE